VNSEELNCTIEYLTIYARCPINRCRFNWVWLSNKYLILCNKNKSWRQIYKLYIKKVKCSRYRPDVAQRVGRDIALLFYDRGTRRGWVVSSTSRPHFTPGKDTVTILQEAAWASGPVWTGGKSRPNRDSIPDRAARSQSLYRLSYPAHQIRLYIILYPVCFKLEKNLEFTW